jgi:4-hydroxy-3-polyprenylbenzoate decarboxylase
VERVIVAVTGASGSVYGKRCVETLVANGYSVDLIFSETGAKVFEYELGLSPGEFVGRLPEKQVRLYDPNDLFAPPSSGSYKTAGMLIAPCSAGTLGHLASGSTVNLIHRSADVCLKEGRPLVLLFRESPINRIHAENFIRVMDAGAKVLPASPAFYGRPKTLEELVDFVVERALRLLLNRSFNLIKDWEGSP